MAAKPILQKPPEKIELVDVTPDARRIVRIGSPDIALALIPWLTPNDQQGQLELGWELHERLRNNPEDTFVLIAIDSDAVALAVLIASNDNGCAQIWHTRVSANFKHSNIELMFTRLLKWAKHRGCKNLYYETDRRTEPFGQKWGFGLTGQREAKGQTLYSLTREV